MSDDKPTTILLVEDEALIALVEEQTLRRYGYAVIIAASGEQAINIIGEQPDIDLVLMDIDLGSGMDGTQAAEIILKNRDVPLIFLSSHTERPIVEKTEKITSYGYIVKDTGETVLVACIKMALRLFAAQNKEREKDRIVKKTTRLLEQTFEQSPVPMVLVSMPDGIIRIINTAAREFLGIADESDYIGSLLADYQPTFKDFDNEGNPGLVKDLPLARSLRGEKTLGEERRIIRKDGNERWELVSAAPIYGEHDDLIAGYLVMLDITGQKRVENALRESEAKYRMLTESIQDVVWILDTDTWRFTYVSPSVFRLRGYTPEEIIAAPFDAALPPDQAEGLKALIRQRIDFFLSGNEPPGFFYRNEVEQTCKDGSTVWTEVVSKYYRNEHTGHVDAVGVTREITDRKRAQDELRDNEERLRLALDATDGSVWDWDLVTNETYYSPRWFTQLGYAPDQFPSNYESWAALTDPEDVKKVEHIVHKAIEQGTGYEAEFRMRAADGSWRWIRGCGKVSARDDSGRPVRMSGINTDITERKQADEQIAALLAEKELLLREMHHRVKNNMAIISSLLSMQMRTVTEPSAVQVLANVRARMDNMKIIFDKLYNAPSLGELSVKEHLPALVQQIIDNFPGAGSIALDLRIGDLMLNAKKFQALGIIINELLTNIMKHAFEGKGRGCITIIVASRERQAMVEVRDDGIGIPESVSLEQSSGFGLLLVRLMTKQLRGTIRLERGNGTAVLLEFER